jgi:hypothetical protein
MVKVWSNQTPPKKKNVEKCCKGILGLEFIWTRKWDLVLPEKGWDKKEKNGWEASLVSRFQPINLRKFEKK